MVCRMIAGSHMKGRPMRQEILIGTTLIAGVVLGGCGEGRYVGSILEPYCAPDGSVVTYQKPNADGSYEGAQASPENCS